MDRRNFIIKTSLGIAGGIIGTPSIIKNSVNYSKEELKQVEILTTNLPSLEKRIMIGNLFLNEELGSLTTIHQKVLENTELNKKIDKVTESIVEFILKKSHDFSKKKSSSKILKKVREELQNRRNYLETIKNFERIKFANFRRDILVSSRNFEEFNKDSLKEYNKFNDYFLKIENLSNEYPNIRKIQETLFNLSSDVLFIKKASKISKIPIEDIIAFANLESNGNEFEIGRDGEINRFQFIPKYVQDIYIKALSQKNELTEFILDKKVGKDKNSLLETIVRDSELNIAIATNFMAYLKENTDKEYQYILAYNKGIQGVKSIPKSTKRKLENPSKISQKEKKYSVFKYYLDFRNAKNGFKTLSKNLS